MATVKQSMCPVPVIMHESLLSTDLHEIMKKQHKCRVSGSTVEDSVIYPQSGIAFLYVPVPTDINLKPEGEIAPISTELANKIEKLTQVHRNCYLLLMMPALGEEQLEFMNKLQLLLTSKPLQILPVHNVHDCIKSMDTIAKVHSKGTSEVLRQRLQSLSYLPDTPDQQMAALKAVGLSPHESQLLLDGMGSLSRVLTAEVRDLVDCSLTHDAARKIIRLIQYDHEHAEREP